MKKIIISEDTYNRLGYWLREDNETLDTIINRVLDDYVRLLRIEEKRD